MIVLKDLRTENNLTQTQLANAIGTNLRSIVRWEKGQSEPSPFYITKIAQFFHVSADFLLGLEDDLGHKSYVDISGTLTPEETKIISAYRDLSPSARNIVLRMLNIED